MKGPPRRESGPESWIRGGCQHDCPDTCAWEVGVRDGRAVELRAQNHHPFTRGALCVKTENYLDRVYAPDRVLRPLKRVGPKGEGAFQEVSWSVALREIAQRVRAEIDELGPECVLPFSHQGSMGIVQERSLDRRFFATLGATRLARDICGYVAAQGIETTLGPGVHMLPEDISHSRFIVLWGTNTVRTNAHLWRRIQVARRAGARLVVIDPVTTATARRADWHLRPRPGTDAVLALGLIHVLIHKDLVDDDYVSTYAENFDELRGLADHYTPELVAAQTGIATGEVRSLATEFAKAQPSVIRLLLGLEKHRNGAATARVIACLPTLVGAWRRPGGGLLHLTSDLHAEALNLDAVSMPELESNRTREVHWAELGPALTELDQPNVRVLFVYNANPATTAPGTDLVTRGLARDDLFTVVHDQMLTDTGLFADYVLPATTMVEHWDLLRAYGHTYVTLNRPAIEPRGEAVSNTELFRRLAAQLGMKQPYLFSSDLDLVKAALDSDSPLLEGIDLDRLLNEGWAELALPKPWLPHLDGFATDSGKCDLSMAELNPAILAPEQSSFPLALLAVKSTKRFFNSTYGDRGAGGDEPAPTLAISAADAHPRGITAGDTVEVFNDCGIVRLPARISDEVPAGLVSMPHGWWASRAPQRYTANLLTSHGLSDRGGGSDIYDVRVDVRLVASPT